MIKHHHVMITKYTINLQKGEKVMKRKIVFLIVASFTCLSVACGSKVPEINTAIQELSEGEEITQEQIDTLFAEYEALSAGDKEKIENYEVLEKYKDVNIDTVKGLQSSVDSVTDDTALRDLMTIKNDYEALNENEKRLMDVSGIQDKLDSLEGVDIDKVESMESSIAEINDKTPFSDIVELKEKYDSLTMNEKKLVEFSAVESRFELTDLEKAALEAAKNVKSCMKSESSFKVKKILVKDDLEKMSFYWVLIDYSGDNSFGVSLDSTSCFGISPEFEDPFFPLAQLTGIEDYLNGTTSYLEYVKCTEEEVEIDVEKIQYYLEQ